MYVCIYMLSAYVYVCIHVFSTFVCVCVYIHLFLCVFMCFCLFIDINRMHYPHTADIVLFIVYACTCTCILPLENLFVAMYIFCTTYTSDISRVTSQNSVPYNSSPLVSTTYGASCNRTISAFFKYQAFHVIVSYLGIVYHTQTHTPDT